MSPCRLANGSGADGFLRCSILMKNSTQTERLQDILTINLKAHSSQSNCNCVMLGYSDVPTANGFGIASETASHFNNWHLKISCLITITRNDATMHVKL